MGKFNLATNRKENDDLFLKLNGVMHSVDKWLESDELNQDEVNRASTMREKTLKIVEDKQAYIEALIKGQETLQKHIAKKDAEIKMYKGYLKQLKKILNRCI